MDTENVANAANKANNCRGIRSLSAPAEQIHQMASAALERSQDIHCEWQALTEAIITKALERIHETTEPCCCTSGSPCAPPVGKDYLQVSMSLRACAQEMARMANELGGVAGQLEAFGRAHDAIEHGGAVLTAKHVTDGERRAQQAVDGCVTYLDEVAGQVDDLYAAATTKRNKKARQRELAERYAHIATQMRTMRRVIGRHGVSQRSADGGASALADGDR